MEDLYSIQFKKIFAADPGNWEEEYYDDPNNPVEPEAPEETLQYSQDQINHAEVVLSLAGYDTEGMTDQDIIFNIEKNPKILELTPKFNVEGTWCHAIRTTDPSTLAYAISRYSNYSKELCVTDANTADFWDFSEYRRFILVFKGVCKVLWNADMYSERQDPETLNEDDQLASNLNVIKHIDTMTEGWINPQECQLIGVKVKNDKKLQNDYLKIKEVLDSLGLPMLNTLEAPEKQIIDTEFISQEEAQEYASCDIDLDSPEHLYEPINEDSNLTYQNQYFDTLINAINTSNLSEAYKALEAGADIHAENDYAIRLASQYGHLEVVKYLAEAGADIHAENDLAIRWASQNGQLEVVQYLAEAGVDIHAQDDSAIQLASQNGHLEVVKYLAENGADIHADNDSAIIWASRNGHLEVVKYLAEAGADIHAYNDYAIRWASQNGHLEVVKYLAEAGADIHAEDDSAIRWASNYGHLDVVQYLKAFDTKQDQKMANLIRQALRKPLILRF